MHNIIVLYATKDVRTLTLSHVTSPIPNHTNVNIEEKVGWDL